jgi:hypothetical protein
VIVIFAKRSKGESLDSSIYIVDLNKKIAKVVAGNGTSLFPVPGNTEWLMKQKGHLWRGGNSLEHDRGRLPYTAKDKHEKWCTKMAEAGWLL